VILLIHVPIHPTTSGPRFIDYFRFLNESDMIHRKSVVSCCNQVLLDIGRGKESKKRFVHSIIKNFNQHYQTKRDTLQIIKNIQHSKLFLQSIVNPNSSSFCNQGKVGNKKLIKIGWIETKQISFSELTSPPQISFHSFKIFISHPLPPTFPSFNLTSMRFKVFMGDLIIK